MPSDRINSSIHLALPLTSTSCGRLAGARYLSLKQGIWVYFFLLIFEGALRKWLFPGLAMPLLIVRDPVALWLILAAWKRGLLPANPYMSIMAVIGVAGIYTAVFVGHGNVLVAIYGARIMLLHFPLIFVIGRIFNRDDVLKIGRVVLWLAIPMTILIAVQFYNPQSAFVNRGVGGDVGGAGFSGALDYFRPPGTFSFTNGTTLFFGLLSSFILYFWINPRSVSRLLLILATACLLAAIPLSISRGLFFQFGVCLVFAILAISRKPQYTGRMIMALGAGALALGLLGSNPFFQTATEAFTVRFETANEQEGGFAGVLGDRYLGGMVKALSESFRQPFFGYGLGMGTNVGSMLLSGELVYMISEEEWGRNIGELGPLLGLAVIFIRLALGFKIAVACYRKVILNDFLPWMLLSFCLLNVATAQWSQPTSLGFSILICGLTLASLRANQESSLF